ESSIAPAMPRTGIIDLQWFEKGGGHKWSVLGETRYRATGQRLTRASASRFDLFAKRARRYGKLVASVAKSQAVKIQGLAGSTACRIVEAGSAVLLRACWLETGLFRRESRFAFAVGR